jgi:hypothetical protein
MRSKKMTEPIDVKKLKIEKRPMAVGIPPEYNNRRSGVINHNHEDSFFIVCWKGHLTKETVKVFVGAMDHFSEVQVVMAGLLRDGGSVSIRTIVGAFFFPHSPNESATFNGTPIDEIYQ